jgi:integrase
MRLNKRTVEAAIYAGKELAGKSGKAAWSVDTRWDDDLKGFGLRLFPSGRKAFVLRYRHEGRSRYLTLGTFPALSATRARQKALRALADLSDQKDPGEERRKARAKGFTVADLGRRFLEDHCKPLLKPLTCREYTYNWGKHVDPALGRHLVESIKPADVEGLHRSMASTPRAANHTLAILSSAFRCAERWGLVPRGSNPCLGIERYRQERRERFLSFEELSRLGQALADEEQAGTSPFAIAALRLLVLTGCRKGEILSLRWNHVDLDGARLNLPDSKTGAKAVLLPPAAVAVLRGLPRMRRNAHVLPGASEGSHLAGLRNPWDRVCARAGLEDVRIHDLRHSFASVAAGSGVSLPLIGKALGHSQPQTTARYAHIADSPLRVAVDLTGEQIASALAAGGEE